MAVQIPIVSQVEEPPARFSPLDIKRVSEFMDKINAMSEWQLSNYLRHVKIKGRQCDSHNCPLAELLCREFDLDNSHVSVVNNVWFPYRGPGHMFELSKAARDFIHNFDRGIYPSLIRKGNKNV